MDWEQKFAALNALGECHVIMRKPGDWYVGQSGVNVREGGYLAGRYGNGKTPSLACVDHWKVLVDDNSDTEQYLVILKGDKRRAVRWNGFMWNDVVESDR